MNIQPLRTNVVIKADKDTKTTESGIMVVREWEKLPHTGEVTHIGPQVTEVKVGDRVRFNRYAYEKIDDDLFIGLEANITAVLG